MSKSMAKQLAKEISKIISQDVDQLIWDRMEGELGNIGINFNELSDKEQNKIRKQVFKHIKEFLEE